MPNHLTGNHPLQRLRLHPEFQHCERAVPVGIAYFYATYIPHQNHHNVVQHTRVYRHLVSWWSCTAPTPTYQRACVLLSSLQALPKRDLRPQELIHAHAGHSASWPLMVPSSWRPEPLCTSPSGASGGPWCTQFGNELQTQGCVGRALHQQLVWVDVQTTGIRDWHQLYYGRYNCMHGRVEAWIFSSSVSAPLPRSSAWKLEFRWNARCNCIPWGG